MGAIQFYLGAYGGGVYEFGNDYKGDGGQSISAYWQSKNLDYGDEYKESADSFKTIEWVKLICVDTNETDVTVSISTDDGATWTDRTETIGSGTNDTTETNFGFWVTGRTFRFKITHSSASDNFQWVRMEVVFIPQGEYFEVT